MKKQGAIVALILGVMIISIVACASGNADTNSITRPEYYNESKVNARIVGAEVLLVKDVDPWDYAANEQVLNNLGITYDIARSEDIAGIDLSQYKVVIIASDQTQEFYDRMSRYVTKLENYVASGGILEAHACDHGWNGGEWSRLLPGRVGHVEYYDNYNYIEAPDHPIVKGLTDDDFIGWNAVSHGYFTNLLPGTTVILTDSYGRPTFIEYPYGSGVVVASMETLEWAFKHGYCQNGKILTQTIAYTYSLKRGVEVSITVDSFKYAPGDEMMVTLDIANPTENNTIFEWYIGAPQRGIWLRYADASIPAGFKNTYTITIPVGDWGASPFGIVHYVHMLDNVSGEVLAQDAALCAYSPYAEAAASVDIEKEIKKAIEGIKLPI